jgi:hypothetical protein
MLNLLWGKECYKTTQWLRKICYLVFILLVVRMMVMRIMYDTIA